MDLEAILDLVGRLNALGASAAINAGTLGVIFWLLRDRATMQANHERALAEERAESQAARALVERWGEEAFRRSIGG